MNGPFVVRDGKIQLSVGAGEQAALQSIPALLDRNDGAEGRLEYTVHPDNPDADARYRELIGEDLTQLRRVDRRAFDTFIAGEPGPPETLEGFMRVIGESRLVLADLLGIEDDSWESERDLLSDPDLALLGWLGYLQDAAVELLSEFL